MRSFITCAVLAATALTASTASAQSRFDRYERLIDGWYHQYLGRHIDHAGLHDYLHALRHGTPLDVIEASILSSHEYYHRNGCTAEGYVAALYRDVLGRRPTSYEFQRMVSRVARYGRNAVALDVLSERAYASTVTYYTPPAPVVVPRPYAVEPGVIIAGPRPAPVYVDPRPSISLRFHFGR